MIQKFKNAKTVFETDGVIGKKRFEKNETEIVQITLESKKNIPAHSLEVFATFFVVNGKGKAIINNEKHDIETGDMYELEAGINRELINTGDDKLEIIVVKYMKSKI